VLRDAWRQLTSPPAMPYHRLFRELHDLPAETSPWKDFPAHATDEWLAVVTGGRNSGHPRSGIAQERPICARVLARSHQFDGTPSRRYAYFMTQAT
jgi:hypothetical protein